MRRIKCPAIGEYVLATRWRDHDPFDPWCLGFVKSVNKNSMHYVVEGSGRQWCNVFRISKAEGARWFKDHYRKA